MQVQKGLRRFFKAFLSKGEGNYEIAELSVSDLPTESTVRNSPGACDLLVNVDYSTVNFKDQLVVTGNYPKTPNPIVPGIDLAGTVQEDASGRYQPGDKVLVNGWGVGTDHWGGYTQQAKVRSDWAIALPESISTLDAAKIGTAGYTSMLCVDVLERRGVTPDSGKVIVTGASGGVGSTSVLLLSQLGYSVTALTGKMSQEPWLKSLGAAEVLDRQTMMKRPAQLNREEYAACVETCGGRVMEQVLTRMIFGGTIAAVGNAMGPKINTTVYPFILRATALVGVDSVFAPKEKREAVYAKYAHLLSGDKLDLVSGKEKVVGLGQVAEVCQLMAEGKHTGRYVVDVNLA